MRREARRGTRPGLRTLIPLVLLCGGLTVAAPSARADGGCNGQAAIAVGSPATLEVPIGAGSAIPSPLSVTCDGAPAPGADVDLTISGDATFHDEFWQQGDVGPITADVNGAVELPIVTSGTVAGPFTISATWEGATATILGEVIGTLQGNPAPPADPALNETVGTHTVGCRSGADDCDEVAEFNGFRQDEALGPLVLPRNWSALTIPEQLFVLTQLERTARGLPPESGLASDWNAIAQQGANAGTDPEGSGTVTPVYQASPWTGNNFAPSTSYPSEGFASIWYGGTDPLQGLILWMYQDGLNGNGSSSNLDCRPADRTGCWGHRNNILNVEPSLACELSCAIGAATAPPSKSGGGDTEFFPAAGNDADPLVFSWATEIHDLPACEQTADTCPWTGQPIDTSSSSPPRIRISISKVRRSGPRITFTVRFRSGRGTIRVAAHDGRRTARTTVRRVSRTVDRVVAVLRPGRWRLTISVVPARTHREVRLRTLRVSVPGR